MKAPRPLSRFAISATVPRCGSTFSMSLRKATACVIDPKREIVAPLLIPVNKPFLGLEQGQKRVKKGSACVRCHSRGLRQASVQPPPLYCC
jgi:hypothetical protein